MGREQKGARKAGADNDSEREEDASESEDEENGTRAPRRFALARAKA